MGPSLYKRPLYLRMRSFQLGMQLVQRVDISLGRGNHDVGVGALPVDDAAVFRKTHRDFALRVGAAGDGLHGIPVEVRVLPGSTTT